MPTMDLFVKKISEIIASQRLIRDGATVVVAYSGGADSTALLVALKRLGYRCVGAHCNFQLRGAESDRDEAHCRRFARELEVEFETMRFQTIEYARSHKISIEMACRELRYGWFDDVCDNYSAKTLAVGHHREDNVETFMLNMLRGTGVDGLTGMSFSRPLTAYSTIDVVRPMLDITRFEIEKFLGREQVSFVVDSTNLESDFCRNKIRNELLPLLRKLFPNADKGVRTTMSNLCHYREVAEQLIEEKVTQCFDSTTGRLNLSRVDDTALAKEVIYRVANRYGFTRGQVEDMAGSHQSGRRFFSDRAEAAVNKGDLLFSDVKPENAEDDFLLRSFDLRLPDYLHIGCDVEKGNVSTVEFVRDGSTAFFDADALREAMPLRFRHWRKGDRMEPFGMRGTRLISDIFSDLKLTPRERGEVWLLADSEERILWVAGIRASRHYSVTTATKKVVRLFLKQ